MDKIKKSSKTKEDALFGFGQEDVHIFSVEYSENLLNKINILILIEKKSPVGL